MGSAADWASVVVTLVLGVAGFAVARGINRDVRLKLAERRLAAYERLWALLRPASPSDPPPGASTRARLHGALTDWYYAHGDGMLLPAVTRNVYLHAKDNLVRPVEQVVPDSSRDRLAGLVPTEQEHARALLARRQLSLLRTQLKSDLEIFGPSYGPSLYPEDRAFLELCGVDLGSRPWRDTAGG